MTSRTLSIEDCQARGMHQQKKFALLRWLSNLNFQPQHLDILNHCSSSTDQGLLQDKRIQRLIEWRGSYCSMLPWNTRLRQDCSCVHGDSATKESSTQRKCGCCLYLHRLQSHDRADRAHDSIQSSASNLEDIPENILQLTKYNVVS